MLQKQVLSQYGHTFSRSYGAILPSSLTRVLSSALVFSTYLPVSVYGTINLITHYEDFPGSIGSTTLRSFCSFVITPQCLIEKRICLPFPPSRLNRDIQHPDGIPSSVPPSLKHYLTSTGILTCFPSTTLLSLALGVD
jgi:hypothetical protein